jgi:hypothetical protein
MGYVELKKGEEKEKGKRMPCAARKLAELFIVWKFLTVWEKNSF